MMIRPFTLFCVAFACIAGMVIYTQKHKTTLLDHQIAKIVYDTQKIKTHTTMLRTEWTLLNQPDRLKALSNSLLPKLRPLQPSQFVQLSSAVNFLPPIQQDPKKETTPGQLSKNIAESDEQTKLSLDEPIEKKIPKKLIVSAQATPQLSAPPPVPPQIKTENASDKPSKKDILKPNITKPNHIESVAYNIQGGNTPSRSEENVNKPTKVISKNTTRKPTFTANNDGAKTPLHSERAKTVVTKTVEKKSDSTATLAYSTKLKKETSTSIKVARYVPKKKTVSSESALGSDSEEALPAPVPFSQ